METTRLDRFGSLWNAIANCFSTLLLCEQATELSMISLRVSEVDRRRSYFFFAAVGNGSLPAFAAAQRAFAAAAIFALVSGDIVRFLLTGA